VAEIISATRFLQSRRSGDIFLPFIVEKAQRCGFFDSLKRRRDAIPYFLLLLKTVL
jgi:hypothetical protein